MGVANPTDLRSSARELSRLLGRKPWRHPRVVHALQKTSTALISSSAIYLQGVRRHVALPRLLAAFCPNRCPAPGFCRCTHTVTSFIFRAPLLPTSSPATRSYRQICINGYDFMLKTQCYATGGYGPDERIMPPSGSLGRSLSDVFGYHAEIPCGSWAAFKLSMYLMRFTGEARFGDWIETILYNAMGATLPPEQDGKCFYYGDYRPSGGMKTYYWHEWPCCSNLHPEHGRVLQYDISA